MFDSLDRAEVWVHETFSFLIWKGSLVTSPCSLKQSTYAWDEKCSHGNGIGGVKCGFGSRSGWAWDGMSGSQPLPQMPQGLVVMRWYFELSVAIQGIR